MAEVIKVPLGLATAIFGTADLANSDADNCDGGEIVDGYKKFFEKAKFDAMNKNSRVADSAWDEPLGAVAKREEQREPLLSLELRKVLAANVVKVEQVTDADGFLWQHAYDLKGTLIDARILS